MPAGLTPRWSPGIYHIKYGPFGGFNEAKCNSHLGDTVKRVLSKKKKSKKKHIPIDWGANPWPEQAYTGDSKR